jgi:hypothetical protein
VSQRQSIDAAIDRAASHAGGHRLGIAGSSVYRLLEPAQAA